MGNQLSDAARLTRDPFQEVAERESEFDQKEKVTQLTEVAASFEELAPRCLFCLFGDFLAMLICRRHFAATTRFGSFGDCRS